MPSKSKAQQRFFGMVDAYKKGEMKNASSKIKKAARGMSMDDVKDFAETKHKGLPEKVEEGIIRLTESDLYEMVRNSVDRILTERIKGERGMNDDEVMRRRNRNFEQDCDYAPNRLFSDPYSPNYSDRIEMESPYHTPEEMESRIANDRRKRHYATQRIHKPSLKDTLLKNNK